MSESGVQTSHASWSSGEVVYSRIIRNRPRVRYTVYSTAPQGAWARPRGVHRWKWTAFLHTLVVAKGQQSVTIVKNATDGDS